VGTTFVPFYTDVPTEHGGNGSDFRCFICSHPTCPLATGGGAPGDASVPEVLPVAAVPTQAVPQ
jgi:hypothetical protein